MCANRAPCGASGSGGETIKICTPHVGRQGRGGRLACRDPRSKKKELERFVFFLQSRTWTLETLESVMCRGGRLQQCSIMRQTSRKRLDAQDAHAPLLCFMAAPLALGASTARAHSNIVCFPRAGIESIGGYGRKKGGARKSTLYVPQIATFETFAAGGLSWGLAVAVAEDWIRSSTLGSPSAVPLRTQ